VVVDDDMDAGDCAALGRELAGSADRVAMVVLGDGSARHTEKAPGYLDVRAAGFDEAVAAAFATGDVDALLGLDAGLARDLMVAGRAPWQVLAGAAAGRSWTMTSSMEIPYGVAYHVAAWT
jgi:aromatic ring-opening dioxygenase LigB subunit